MKQMCLYFAMTHPDKSLFNMSLETNSKKLFITFKSLLILTCIIIVQYSKLEFVDVYVEKVYKDALKDPLDVKCIFIT